MTRVHDFAGKLAQGQQTERAVADWLSAQGWRVRPASPAEQRQGVDLHAERDGRGLTIEVKADDRAGQTGHAFIELWSNWERGKLGWALTCQADRLLYCVSRVSLVVQSTLVYVVRTPELRRIELLDGCRGAVGRNPGYHSLGMLLPLERLEALSQSVVELGGPVEL